MNQPKNWLDSSIRGKGGHLSLTKPISTLWAFGTVALMAGLVVGFTISSYPEIAYYPLTPEVLGRPSTGYVLGVETLPGLLDDGRSYPPPTSGTYAYNSYIPASAGSTYSDPVFGSTIRRLSADGNPDDSYARNMWWNADGTRYMHRAKNGTQFPDFWNIIDAATGEITHYGIHIGDIAADGGFDPVNPNVLYKYSGRNIVKVTLESNGTWTESVYFTAPSTIRTLGGTLNWLDAAGRYMLVRYGSEPSVYLYDRNNFTAGPFANPINASDSADLSGYLGLSPDGNYVVGYDSDGGFGFGEGISYRVDHNNRSLGNRNRFWSLCGDHGTFLSASDGRNYMVVSNCYDSPEIWRVDITNNAAGPLDIHLQKLLSNNQKLLTFPNWNNGVHFSAAAKGNFRDWVFVSTEDNRDTFNSNLSFWQTYSQEIIAINILTGETKRLAHHRSRSVTADYYNAPRLTASWGGEYIAWNSNYNRSGSIDVYALPFASSSGTPTPPPSPTPTPPPGNDTVPPVISNINASNLTSTSVAINWNTNEMATGQVEYCRTSTRCGVFTPLVSSLTLDHTINILVLQPTTRYYYWIISQDAAGNTQTSPVQTLITPQDNQPPEILSFSVQGASRQASVSARATDVGGSHLSRAIINRAVYGPVCNESVKTGCVWRNVKTVYAPKNSDNWNISHKDRATTGTYWYGLHVYDRNGNRVFEPTPPGPVKVQIGG